MKEGRDLPITRSVERRRRGLGRISRTEDGRENQVTDCDFSNWKYAPRRCNSRDQPRQASSTPMKAKTASVSTPYQNSDMAYLTNGREWTNAAEEMIR